MSSEQLAEIKSTFEGTWRCDRSECFEDFLREVGVNFLIRKMAIMSKPDCEIKVEEDKITISLNAGFMVKSDTFKLGEEFSTEHQGKKSKAIASYEDGKLVINTTPEDQNIKKTKATREIVGNELLLTMYIGDVVCKRYFKRLPK